MKTRFELLYSIQQVSWELKFSEPWVRERLREGASGAGVVQFTDGDIRVPADGVNTFLDRNLFFVGADARHCGLLETHMAIPQVGFLYQRSEKWVRDRIAARDFGPLILKIGTDIRIPVSGVKDFIRKHPYVYSEAVSARNIAELRRKLNKPSDVTVVQTSLRAGLRSVLSVRWAWWAFPSSNCLEQLKSATPGSNLIGYDIYQLFLGQFAQLFGSVARSTMRLCRPAIAEVKVSTWFLTAAISACWA